MGYWGETGGHCSLDSCWLAGAPSHRGLLYDFRDREDGEEGRKESLRLRSGLWITSFIRLFIHLSNHLKNKYQATYTTDLDSWIHNYKGDMQGTTGSSVELSVCEELIGPVCRSRDWTHAFISYLGTIWLHDHLILLKKKKMPGMIPANI